MSHFGQIHISIIPRLLIVPNSDTQLHLRFFLVKAIRQLCLLAQTTRTPATVTQKVPAVATSSSSLQPKAPLTKAHLLRVRASGRRRGMESSSQQQAPGTLTLILVSTRLVCPAARHHHMIGRTSRCCTYRYKLSLVCPSDVYLRCPRKKGNAAHSTTGLHAN